LSPPPVEEPPPNGAFVEPGLAYPPLGTRIINDSPGVTGTIPLVNPPPPPNEPNDHPP
jgi:hypothetical protein